MMCRLCQMISMAAVFFVFSASGVFAQISGSQGDGLSLALADKYVDITTNFSGRNVVVFGVNETGGTLVVTLTGPAAYTLIRQKGQALGIWLNAKTYGFKDVPLYYDYALNGEESDLGPVDLLRLDGIGVNAMQYAPRARVPARDTRPFHEALIRHRQQAKHYAYDAKGIELIGEKLFKISFELPADVPTGEYTVKAMVYQGNVKVAERREYLQVRQAGFSARLYSYANNHAFLYGVAVVFFAVFMGYAANVIFSRR
jgi:uncharacterized protein (TIGR02186 family)